MEEKGTLSVFVTDKIGAGLRTLSFFIYKTRLS